MRRVLIAVAGLMAIALAAGITIYLSPRGDMARADFAAAMSNVNDGMNADEVIALLGKPSDVRTPADLPIGTLSFVDVWGYGTEGHMSYPTLGTVVMESGTVVATRGGDGTPPDPSMMDETTLRQLLRMIDAINDGEEYQSPSNPLRLIQCANALQPLGKEKAMAVLREYVRVGVRVGSRNYGLLNVQFLLRLLYVVPANTGYFPRPQVGAPIVPIPDDPKEFPLFPLALIDDVPVNLVPGYNINGIVEGPQKEMDELEKNGIWRSGLLHPTDDPMGVMDKILKSPWWTIQVDPEIYRRGLFGGEHLFSSASSSFFKLVDTVYPLKLNRFGQIYPMGMGQMEYAIAEIRDMHIQWDPAKNIYVRGDGSSLEEWKPHFYRRQMWQFLSGGKLGLLSLLRMSDNEVDVHLDYGKNEKVYFPDVTVKIHETGNGGRQISEFHLPRIAGNTDGMLTGKNDIQQLPQGTSLKAEALVDGTAMTSPVMTP